jgi:hypothetical protein
MDQDRQRELVYLRFHEWGSCCGNACKLSGQQRVPGSWCWEDSKRSLQCWRSKVVREPIEICWGSHQRSYVALSTLLTEWKVAESRNKGDGWNDDVNRLHSLKLFQENGCHGILSIVCTTIEVRPWTTTWRGLVPNSHHCQISNFRYWLRSWDWQQSAAAARVVSTESWSSLYSRIYTWTFREEWSVRTASDHISVDVWPASVLFERFKRKICRRLPFTHFLISFLRIFYTSQCTRKKFCCLTLTHAANSVKSLSHLGTRNTLRVSSFTMPSKIKLCCIWLGIWGVMGDGSIIV